MCSFIGEFALLAIILVSLEICCIHGAASKMKFKALVNESGPERIEPVKSDNIQLSKFPAPQTAQSNDLPMTKNQL